jgi:hypothetical protein
MKFAINLDTLRIHATVGSPVPLTAVEMILGSTEPVEITAFRGSTPEIIDTPLQLGIKAASDYAGDFLAYLSTWTQTGDTFEGVLNLNTVEAGTLLGTDASADILLEIAWGDPERTAFAIAGKLKNDLIKGTEGVPTEGTPAYPQPADIMLKSDYDPDEDGVVNGMAAPVVSSGAISALTSPQQLVIVEGSIVTTTDGKRWVYSGTGSKVLEASYVQLSDVTIASTDITDSTAAGRSMLTGVMAENLFVKSDPDTVAWVASGQTMVTGQRLHIGVAGAVLDIAAGATVTLPGTLTGGTDYAIWAKPTGGLEATVNFVTPPVALARLVGGAHYALGGNAAAQAGGNATPQWNPFSEWDLKFRPACPNPRGMALIANGFWADIYLANTDCDLNGTSANGVTITDGSSAPKVPTSFGGNGSTTYGNLTWFSAAELGAAYGKRLLSLDEFQAAAYGVTEQTSRGTDPVTTGLDAARTSRWGLMQATGSLYTWCMDSSWRNGADSATVTGSTTSGSAVITSLSHSRMMPGTYVTGTGIPANAYILSVDPVALTLTLSANATATNAGITVTAGSYLAGDLMTNALGWAWRANTGSRGSLYLNNSNGLVRALAGGNWTEGGYAGSRASNWSFYAWHSYGFVSARFRSDHLRLV